ncbi:Uncharacterised protein [Nocardia otitidiscaviarum]|uniref:Uncharacterized protein n=1 Tax=Nocardia otitidiscaviarum TaxID=1823 RepID=A0A378Y7B6_9NOCA|nr:hypothetical protein [Nocardia otitidiscaviarum]SUA72748.1 Uncharacterised protein [Nocardia otitidiscaviarum]
MSYDAEDFIFVDRERVRGLVSAMNTAADTLGGIRADDQTLSSTLTLNPLLPGTGIDAACMTGSTNATIAMTATTEQVRVMAVRTGNGLSAVLAQDADSASRIPR